MKPGRTKPSNLREACLTESLALIEREGVEALSMRDVARRLGVSHQAPYRHFASRDHILAELVRRAYAAFAEALRGRPRFAEPHADLESMGRAYLDYAERHPLQYRLMFGTPLPDPAVHPEMMLEARAAFAMLREAIALLPGGHGRELDHDALFVWSALHGAASLSASDAAHAVGLPAATLAAAPLLVLLRIGGGLRLGESGPQTPARAE